MGYCDVTPSGPSDCYRGSKGSWVLHELAGPFGTRSIETCIERCRRCPRCAYVSISWVNDECAWFAECSLDHLKLAYGGETYTTLHVPQSRNL